MITTTLNAIRAHGPCSSGWKKLLAYLGKTEADDEALPLLTVLDSNGFGDTLWCLRALGPEHNGWIQQYAIWCARQVQHLMSDPRSLAVLEVSERYANGNATDEELSAARAAARAAALAAAESAAAESAASAAWAARAAAWAAAESAASAAESAARAAAWAARAVARSAAESAAAEWSVQTARLREILL